MADPTAQPANPRDEPASALAAWAAKREQAGAGPASRACRLVLDRAAAGAVRPAAQNALVATLDLLAELGVDEEAQAACVLHEFAANGLVLTDADFAAFPADVRALVEGQQAAEKVWTLHANRGASSGNEGLRRLLLAIIRDLRVVFILLARQLVRMRAAERALEAERRALAQLSADIHAPLANRLGIWQVKWELEDLAFRYLQPDVYRRIATLLDERRGGREAWIAKAKAQLTQALAKAGLHGDIAGRPKHIYSIWRKMQRKGLEFSELYDVRALRVLVDDVATCYAALGIVHTLWPPIPSEFDDYIARPKGNHYQSLHTAVIGPEGKTLEVQIRTHEMHRHAELGVAAHWRYKEGGGGDASFERKIAWMRQLLENRDGRDDDEALLAGFRTEVVEDRVYLLTPKGQVIDLPRGATVLDFAYAIHTDVGHRCRGAKVNERIVPLTFQPASGDRIEVLTGKVSEPRRDWLSPHHGFLTTHRAREKVRTWFKRIDLAQKPGRRPRPARARAEAPRPAPCRSRRPARTFPAEEPRRPARGARTRRRQHRPDRTRAARAERAGARSRRRAAAAADPRAERGAGRHRHRRCRQPADPARALLPSAARRRDRRLHHARPRRLGAPGRLRPAGQPARARRQSRGRGRVGHAQSRPPTTSTSWCAATTANGCTRTSATRSPRPTRT